MHSRDNSTLNHPNEFPSSRRRGVTAGGDGEASPWSAKADRGPLPDSDFVLSALRAATLRARLAATELDMIGLALKGNLVTVEGALGWLHDVDLFDHVIYRPVFDAH